MYRSDDQRRYAEVVAQYLAEPQGKPLLLHGAAGLGKTRAFLVEAFRHAASKGGRVLVATATVQLVEQLATSEDLRVALADCGKALNVQRYISQRQFVSPSRAAGFGLDAQIGESTDAVLLRTDEKLKPEDICIDRSCSFAEREPYLAQKAACADADVVLSTHAALLLDHRTGGRLIQASGFGVVIVDEADRLPAAASLQLDANLTAGDLAWLDVEIKDDLAASLTRALERIGKKLAATADQGEVDALQRLRANAADMLAAVLNPAPWRRVAQTQGGIALRVMNPARILAGLVKQLPAVVFTSGTLAIDGRLDAFRHALDVKDAHPRSCIIEPARHGALQFVVAKRELRVDSEQWVAYVAAAVGEARKHGGRVLVLTTSYSFTEALGSRLPGVTAHARGESLSAVIRRFDTDTLISPAAWEGLDLPFSWSDVVIPRIPYPGPDEVLDLHFLNAQDQAMRRLTQGLARGLRRQDQACTAWLLDPRFPLPSRIINAGIATQQQATNHLRLVAAIPQRFRVGLRATFEKAEIYELDAGSAVS